MIEYKTSRKYLIIYMYLIYLSSLFCSYKLKIISCFDFLWFVFFFFCSECLTGACMVRPRIEFFFFFLGNFQSKMDHQFSIVKC